MKRHFSLLIIFFGWLLLLAALVLFLNLTSPLSVGPTGILLTFVLIYGVSFLSLLIISRIFEMIYRAIWPPTSDGLIDVNRSRRNRKRLNLIMASLSFVPIFLMSLNSIGQMSFRDVVLIVVIEVLAIFYIIRRV